MIQKKISPRRAVYKKMGVEAARAACSKKASGITLYDVSAISAPAEYILIALADSPPQMEAVAEAIIKNFKSKCIIRLGEDGKKSPLWRVLDYGGLIIHVMNHDTREFYALDKIYSAAPAVKWEPAVRSSSKKAAGKPGKKRGTKDGR